MKRIETKDYNLFESVDGNRAIDTLHVEKLINSIKSVGNISSITCTKKGNNYVIIDGQHRFEACKKLNIPVIIDLYRNIKNEAILFLNKDQRRWSQKDYLNLGVQRENENYKKLKDYYENNKLSLSALLYILGSGDVGFKELKWQMNSEEIGKKIISYITDFKSEYNINHCFYVKFLQAFKAIVKSGNYNHERMLSQLEKCSFNLLRQPNVSSYVENIMFVYNYRVRQEKKVNIKE